MTLEKNARTPAQVFVFFLGGCFFGSVVCLQMTLGKECMTNGSGFFIGQVLK
jgi:hypothetical protein